MEQYNKTIQKVVNIDGVIKEEIKEHHLNRPEIPHDPHCLI